MKTPVELTAPKNEVETMSKQLHELTDDELELVTGGKNYRKTRNPITRMKCEKCGYEVEYAGHFEGMTFTCKKCHTRKSMKAVKFIQPETLDIL